MALGLLLVTRCFGSDDLFWSECAALPDDHGFAGSFAGESEGALLVAGGANFPGLPPWEGGRKVWHDRVFVLRDPGAAWAVAGHLPAPTGYGVSIGVDGGLLMVGGGDAVRHTAEVRRVRWNKSSLLFEDWPPLPRALAYAAGALVGRRVYVAGGLATPDATRAENVLLVLDVDHREAGWRELPPCPGGGRFLATAAAHDGRFHLFGGARFLADGPNQGKREYLRDAWRYDAIEGWKRLADLPGPLAGAPTPAPAIDDAILILGGDDGSQVGTSPREHRGFSRTMLAYSPKLDIWRSAGELPFALVTTTATRWNQRLVVPGGETKPGQRSTQIWISAPVFPSPVPPR